jgi:tRNA-specific 2-thiouridylase
MIGIPFYIWDMAEEFHAGVVENFIEEYAQGRTPNPCLRCNEKIKFEAVLDRASALGYDAVATGHYAITKEGELGRTMHRAVDPLKDQSYVLAVLTARQLAGAMFPLGDTKKDDVRKEAKARGLYVANKPDSHDICFIPSGNNAGWLRERLGSEAGPIVDEEGNQVGEHQGAYTYTIGQRRGLGLSVPGAGGVPRYVLKIEPKSNTIVVGTKDALAISTIIGESPIWCGVPPIEETQHRGFAQIRAHGAALPCTYLTTPTSITAVLDEPLFGLATGQGLVIYDGDRVVGSATVNATL